jgi:hypothetical protein
MRAATADDPANAHLIVEPRKVSECRMFREQQDCSHQKIEKLLLELHGPHAE